MKLGIPVYQGVNLLDVAGPYEMFKWVDAAKGLEVILISEDGRPVTTMNQLRFEAHASFVETPKLDVIWVPGGGLEALERVMALPSPYIGYLQQVAQSAEWVCSVCEGAMLLARAGLLDGHKATTHWAFDGCLSQFKAIEVVPDHPRFVVSDKRPTGGGARLTGGGIASGLDEALKLIELLFDEATATDVQVNTQYFPKPPVSGQIPPGVYPCQISW